MLTGCTSNFHIKNYCESKIAKHETQDCTVRAIASAFDTTYDKAHSFVKEKFGRKDRDGVRGFASTLKLLSIKNFHFNNKEIIPIPKSAIEYPGSLRFQEKMKQMGIDDPTTPITTKILVERFPKGNYVVVVRGHAFALIDGKIIGNREDYLKPRTKINNLFQIRNLASPY